MNLHYHIRLSVLLCTLCVLRSDCALVQLYEESSFRGRSLELRMDYGNIQCINLPSQWLNKASSINTDNHCVQLFSELNCSGKKINVYQGTAHYDFTVWRFNKKTKSVKLCDEHIDHTQENVHTVLFNEYDSYTYYMNVEYCENIPSDYDKSLIRSVNPMKACFHFFASVNCEGQRLIFRKNPDGTIPSQNGLQSIASVGLCNKCNVGKHESVFSTSTTKINSTTPTLSNSTNETMEEIDYNRNETSQESAIKKEKIVDVANIDGGIGATTIIAISAAAISLVNAISMLIGLYNYYKKVNAVIRRIRPNEI